MLERWVLFIIGGTIYPGLMVTASAIYHTLNSLTITLDVREVGRVVSVITNPRNYA
jgi:hypothetical protein